LILIKSKFPESSRNHRDPEAEDPVFQLAKPESEMGIAQCSIGKKASAKGLAGR
jgi:hypothetical protein